MFEFWDWVGGRYSLWSAIGLSIAVLHRHGQFRAAARPAPTPWTSISAPRRWKRICRVTLGVLGVWYNNFFGAQTQAILPYDQYMHRFPAYFQQGDMESNGKSVDARRQARRLLPPAPSSGASPAPTASTPSINSSTRAPSSIPADFLAPIETQNPLGEHHAILLSNFFAQTEALMKGKTEAEVRAELAKEGITGDRRWKS